MRLIGMGGRGEWWRRGIREWSGKGLCGRCWGDDVCDESKRKMRGSLHCAVHDGTVNSFGRDDVSFSEGEECELALLVNNPTLATIKLSRRWGTRCLPPITLFRVRSFAKVAVVFVDPVLAGWGEDVEIDAVGECGGGVREVAGNDEDLAFMHGLRAAVIEVEA
jgi:hypothetical protein